MENLESQIVEPNNRKELAAVNCEKEDLLYIFAHDLKEPSLAVSLKISTDSALHRPSLVGSLNYMADTPEIDLTIEDWSGTLSELS